MMAVAAIQVNISSHCDTIVQVEYVACGSDLTAQSKLHLTKGECINVNRTRDQADKHGQAFSIYFAYFQTS